VSRREVRHLALRCRRRDLQQILGSSQFSSHDSMERRYVRAAQNNWTNSRTVASIDSRGAGTVTYLSDTPRGSRTTAVGRTLYAGGDSVDTRATARTSVATDGVETNVSDRAP
jgi:hypothetical protein